MSYRLPNNDINKFIDEMSNILDILNNENKLCYIIGDFNNNLFNHEVHAPPCNFLDLMFLHCYIPLINKPTRVINESATLIDKFTYK